MTISFTEETSAPVKTRENEFREFVKAMAAKPGVVFSYTIAATPKLSVKDALVKSYEKYEVDKRKMAQAGGELETQVTIRKDSIDELKDGSLKVYLHATKKVRRTRKES